MTPPWLPLPTELPGREDELTALARMLVDGGVVGVAGAAGVGKTTLAGAAACASGRPIFAVSMLCCRDDDDAQRALGDAAGTSPVGDEGALVAAMRSRHGLLVVVDDVECVAVLAAVERLLAAVPDSGALVLSEEPVVASSLTLGEVGGRLAGTALLTGLGQALGIEPAAALAALGPGAAALAAWPAGLWGGTIDRVPAAALRPAVRDRAVLRRGIAALLAPATGSSDAARRSVLPLIELARGAHLAVVPDVRDVFVLRQLATLASEPTGRGELAAAEARCLLVFGQPDAAGAGLAAASGGGPGGDALLAAARSELGFHLGDLDAAWVHALAAADAFGAAGDAAGRASLWRRVAERLTERAEVERAEEAWRRTRQASRLLGDRTGLAAALRGAASLALSRGEWIGAGALHEEAADADTAVHERLNLRLGEAALGLVRGEHASVRRALDTLTPAAEDDALFRANLARRRADTLLRGGDHDPAILEAERAAALYAALGETVAAGSAWRVSADALALAGRLREAHEHYEKALRMQLRCRDWSGLARTLDHAAILADSQGRREPARRLREQRVAVGRARGAGPS
ncbi:MAG: hypothetical protein EXR71_05405 [Myxococcales bacterium]|nr:hypothetical protein [Myxococcales bacterium]